MRTTTVIEVAAAHIDRFGRLDHVEAVRYFEAARGHWYRRCGLYQAEGGRRMASVVVHVRYDYRRECFLGERLSLATAPVSMGRKSFVLAHELRKPHGELAIEGEATSVIMDLGLREVIPVPACMARYLPRRG